MRKSFQAILAICAVALLSMGYVSPQKKTEILNGEEARQAVVYYAATNITYIAESAPGASVSNAVWQCTKIELSGSAIPYSKIITVLPYLAAPYDGGTNMPTLFGD